MSRVALVGLSAKDNVAFEKYFQTVGVTCEKLAKIENALERVPTDPPALIVAGRPDNLEELRSLKAVLKASAPATPFIVTMTESTANQALETMNTGAYDCLVPPFTKLDVLAAAKRAGMASGRAIFTHKVREEKPPYAAIATAVILFVASVWGIKHHREGPPAQALNLGSATLSGIQWEGRELWVGNWVDATVTHYILNKGILKKSRTLSSDEIFRMQDSQPILVCNMPEAMATVGFDLKFRTHQRAVGLPTLQTAPAPGPNPTGLAWDGNYLWSADGETGLLYKHGPDLRVIDTVKSLLAHPQGLAWDGKSFWVVGGSPLQIAQLEQQSLGMVWKGPYQVTNLLPEGMTPSGMAVGFGRLWAVTGGAPHMVSKPLKDIERTLQGWGK